MRKVASIMLGLGVLLGSATALAQDFGSQGDAAFGAERLFGVHSSRATLEDLGGGGDDETDTTSFSFAWQGEDTSGGFRNPYDAPRVAFDYFLIDHLSVGGALTYADVSVEGAPDWAHFMVSPRVGYAHMFNSTIGVWPRAGFSYHSAATSDASISGLGMSIECMFPVVPGPHFAFEFGLTLDMDFTGEWDPNIGPDRDLTYRSIGVRVGLLGWL